MPVTILSSCRSTPKTAPVRSTPSFYSTIVTPMSSLDSATASAWPLSDPPTTFALLPMADTLTQHLTLAQNLVGCDFPPHKYGYLYGSSVELAADPG
jgi:hypothetical protein